MELTREQVIEIAEQASTKAINEINSKEHHDNLNWFMTKPGIAIALILVGLGSWKGVSELRQSHLEQTVSGHSNLVSHPKAENRITILETQFGYIDSQLSEIKYLLRNQTDK